MPLALGFDIGGSAIKSAIVETDTGTLVGDVMRLPCSIGAMPEYVLPAIQEICLQNPNIPVGIGFPGVVQKGIVFQAANLGPAWIGTNIPDRLRTNGGITCKVINDADAAGLAEITFGAGRYIYRNSLVLVLTFGTGIGSGMFYNGVLVPNMEFGLIEIDGRVAESVAAARWLTEESLTLDAWAKRVNKYLSVIERLTNPDSIIFGGGISERFAELKPMLKTQCPLLPASLKNNAGIIGAAMCA